MIPVTLDQLFLSNMGFVVILKGVSDPRSLPIFIGAAEAQAIAIHVNDLAAPRPLTHDLLKTTLETLECALKRVIVSDLQGGTFFATLILEKEGNEIEMDSRPSDALAIALRCSAPIFVANKVMDEAGQKIDTKDATAKETRRKSHLEELEHNLKKAVEDERYEDAAKIRDHINRLKHTHTDN